MVHEPVCAQSQDPVQPCGARCGACERTRWEAASATPCAWLPAEEQMTPRASCSADSEAILLYAPRSLNENTCRAAACLMHGPHHTLHVSEEKM